MSEGRIVAEIQPDPDRDRPLFRIVRSYERDAGPNVRPCNHPEFVLDERWATVTCGKCGERVDAFAALLRHAEWWERMERRRQEMLAAEKRLLTESLRRLKRLRDTTPEEVAEIDAMLNWPATPSVDEMRALERRLSEAVRERKWERKRQRRNE